MKSLDLPKLKPSGDLMLAPMLAMLKGLYENSKDRIAEQNVREEKDKKWFADIEAKHKKKLASIEAEVKAHKMNDEFAKNMTIYENSNFAYWGRVRQRQHRQYHLNLQIQHAMMKKVSTMISMYEKTLSGKADPELMRRQLHNVEEGIVPGQRIYLLEVDTFCHESLAQVRAGRQELDTWAQEERLQAPHLQV